MDHKAENRVRDLRRNPSGACVICNRRYEIISGSRLIASQLLGFSIAATTAESLQRKTTRIDDELTLFTWGPDGIWSEETIACAVGAVAAGEHPWFCQACGNRTCETCGAPLERPSGYDYLDPGAAELNHCGILGVPPHCTACKVTAI